jgi:hypothetical protein
MTNYRRWLTFLIAGGFIFRCIIASSVELGNDEVYYWTYSQYLQANYFEHPPMVAFLVRLFTFNLTLEQFEIFVRLGSIICCAFATFFMYKTAALVHSEKAGFIAALLYNTSLYGSIITGVFVLPDSPQMLFWTASLYLLARIYMSNNASYRLWILFGIASGLATLSKLHGMFLWSGVILFAIINRRIWLRSTHIYISLLTFSIFLLPVIWWNIKYDFITYRFHSARLKGSLHEFQIDNLLREISGQVFYNNPFNFVITVIALVALFRKWNREYNTFLQLLVYISLPMILVLIFISIFNATRPHWSGPAYVTLIVLAAAGYAVKQKPNIPSPVKWSLGFYLFIVIAGITIINFYPGTSGNKSRMNTLGEGDFTLNMYGWKQARPHMDSLIQDDSKHGLMSKDALFVSNKWFPAAHIDYYFARPEGKYVIGIGSLFDLHHYAWLNTHRLKNRKLDDAYCVVPSNYYLDVRSFYAGRFNSIDSATTIPVYRNGKICKYYFVYRMRGFTGEISQ